MDNKNLFDFLENKNIKDAEYKILLERYKDDFEILKKCVELFDPIDGNTSFHGLIFLISKIKKEDTSLSKYILFKNKSINFFLL